MRTTATRILVLLSLLPATAIAVEGTAFDRLPARSVDAVLASLMEIKRAADSPHATTIPTVVLYLKGGAALEGRVMDLASAGGARALLLETPAARGGGRDGVYVDPGEIIAIKVLDLGSIAGQTPFAAPAPPATRLEAQRRAEDHSRALSTSTGGSIRFEVAWKGIGEDAPSIGTAIDAMEQATEAIRWLSIGLEGRREIARRLKRVVVSEAGGASAILDGDALKIGIASAKGRQGRLSSDEIRRLLEEAL